MAGLPAHLEWPCRDLIGMVRVYFPWLHIKSAWAGPSPLMPDQQWTIYLVSNQNPSPDLFMHRDFRTAFEDYLDQNNLVERDQVRGGGTLGIVVRVVSLNLEGSLRREGFTAVSG